VGVYSGPEITSDGLVLALDAGNSKGFDDDENLLTYSEQFNDASWFKNNYNVTANATSAPDGTLTADKLIAINASTFHDLFKSPGLSSNTYTLSIFAKAAEQSFIQLRIDDGVLSRVAMFNLSTGSVSSSSNVTSPTITSYPNGWYRCSITVTTNIINVVFNGFPTSSNANYSGDGVSGVFIWGAQFEYGSSASPYYPTTATTKTRGTTLIDMTGRGNSGTLTNGPTYSSANGGSLVFDGTNDTIITGNSGITGNNPWSISIWVNVNISENGAGRQGWIIWEGSAGQNTNELISIGVNGGKVEVAHWNNDTVFSNSSITFGTFQNIVVTFDGSNEKIYINSINTDNKTTSLSVTDGFWYLASAANANGFLNCNISQASIYNRALTAAEIQQNFNALRGRFGI
jgi:hypothetical protein